MPNMVDCMMRNVQRFVEYDLAGLVRWDRVRAIVPAEGDGNAVEVSFALDGKQFNISVESSELRPSLGRITMNNKAQGPIDETTWTSMALEIKSHHAAAIRRQGQDIDTSMKELTHG